MLFPLAFSVFKQAAGRNFPFIMREIVDYNPILQIAGKIQVNPRTKPIFNPVVNHMLRMKRFVRISHKKTLTL